MGRNDSDDSEEDAFKPRKSKKAQENDKTVSSSAASVEPRKKRNKSKAVNDTEISENSDKTRKSKRALENDETVSTSVTSVEPRKEKSKKSKAVKDTGISEKSDRRISNNENNAAALPRSTEFCPICQVPLDILKISAAMHTSSCAVPSDSSACPAGSTCLNSNLFHYRDFTHHELAAFRVSEDYIEPDVIFTPQKAKLKRTPKTTSGKKRPSKSPLSSSAKLLKKDEPSCLKDLPPESPIISSEGKQIDETKKRLFSDDLFDMETEDCAETSVNTQQNLEQTELWCSDLILSGATPQQEMVPCTTDGTSALKIKSEPQSQNTFDGNGSASSAKVTIHYDKTVDENKQDLVRNKIQCSDSCRQSSEYHDVLQANCSFLIKATGVNREEAMIRSPLSVTLMVNNSGWEGLQIKGNTATNVHKIDVSLCNCNHLICVKCCVNNRDILKDVKVNLKEAQEEKFFSTLGDLGLKSQKLSVQPYNHNASERKKLLLSENNLITVSSAIEGRSFPSEISNEDPVSSEVENERNNESEEPVTVVNAFSLLKQNGLPERPVTPTASIFTNARRSGSSAPTPVPMVVSKNTGSSWTLVAAAEKLGSTGGRTYGSVNKKVPAFKRIPDTPFVVDAFNYGMIPGAKIYFLSHFHSDHYIGLKKNFNFPIYCSQVTANLVHLKIRVDKQYLHILKIGEPRVICGVEVEVYDANHCPGAVMILFRLLDGRSFLHVGDFRAHPSMEEHLELRHVDKLYLDTTYCDPAYDFPFQEEVVEKVVHTIKGHLIKSPATLIVCGTYTIGKEKVFMGIAEAFNFKIWTTGDKKKVLQCLEDRNLSDRLTSDPLAAQIHVLAMREIATQDLSGHLNKFNCKYSHVIGFKPTGWSTSTSLKGKASDFQRTTHGKVTIYGVPYSEHSSFSELRRFVRFVRPKDIQVTVNLGKSAQYKKLFQQWLSSNRDTDGQSKVVQYFTSTSR